MVSSKFEGVCVSLARKQVARLRVLSEELNERRSTLVRQAVERYLTEQEELLRRGTRGIVGE